MKIRLLALVGVFCGLCITILALMITMQHIFDPHFSAGQATKLAVLLIVGTSLSVVSYITYKVQKTAATNRNDLELEVRTLSDYQQQRDAERHQQPSDTASQTTISSNQKEE